MKKVLIVGNLYSLAKKMASIVDKVFVIPGNPSFVDFAEIVDIREDNAIDVLNFVLENDIDLTIVTSCKGLKSDLVSLFLNNNKPIFAPPFDSANYTLSLSAVKKLLYKLKVPTPKFAIFDKNSLAFDYLQKANFPLIISNDDNSKRQCCTTIASARNYVDDLFMYGEDKVVFQDYVYGHEFTLYVVSDGYQILPLTTVANFKFSESGDGGSLSNGVGAYVPDNKISNSIVEDILNNVALRFIQHMQKNGTPYVGILGIDAVLLNDNSFSVLGFKPFFSDFDCNAVLNSIDENIYELFDACANGFFADEYEDILVNDNISVSCVIKSTKGSIPLETIQNLDSEITFLNDDKSLVLTSCAKTLSRAKNVLQEDISFLPIEGIKCRSDIYS